MQANFQDSPTDEFSRIVAPPKAPGSDMGPIVSSPVKVCMSLGELLGTKKPTSSQGSREDGAGTLWKLQDP